jgi:WD40 repeat protein
MRTGKQVAVLEGHTLAVNDVDVCENTGTIVSAGDDGTVKIWNPSAASRVTVARHDGCVWGLAEARLGLSVVSGSQVHTPGPFVYTHAEGTTVMEWDPCDGANLARHRSYSILAMAGLTARFVLVASSRGAPMAFDLERGRLGSIVTDGLTSGLAVAGIAERMVVAAAAEKEVTVWSIESERQLTTLRGHQGLVTSLSFTPEGRRLVSGSRDGTVKVWDWASAAELQVLPGHEREVRSLLVMPDGEHVITGSGSGRLRFWRFKDAVELRRVDGHTKDVTSLVLACQGTRLISTSDDGSLVVWTLPEWAPVARFRADSAIICSLAMDEWATIVAGDLGGTVHFLRLETPSAL